VSKEEKKEKESCTWKIFVADWRRMQTKDEAVRFLHPFFLHPHLNPTQCLVGYCIILLTEEKRGIKVKKIREHGICVSMTSEQEAPRRSGAAAAAVEAVQGRRPQGK
jgi:hypothetical protein